MDLLERLKSYHLNPDCQEAVERIDQLEAEVANLRTAWVEAQNKALGYRQQIRNQAKMFEELRLSQA